MPVTCKEAIEVISVRQRGQPGKWTRADGEEGWDPAFILKVHPTGFPGRVEV